MLTPIAAPSIMGQFGRAAKNSGFCGQVFPPMARVNAAAARGGH